MANKLKDIFSNKMVDMGGKIRFETPDAYKIFGSIRDCVGRRKSR